MSPRIGSQKPPVVSKPVVAPKTASPPSGPPPRMAEGDHGYADAKDKKASITGRYQPVTRAQVPVDPALVALVGKLRRAVQSGGAQPAPPSAASVLKKIGPPGRDQIKRLGEELKKLPPEQRKLVWDALPPKVREAAIKDLRTPSPVDRSIAMLHAQAMTDSELKAAAADMRAGGLTNEGMQLAVATELAARTKWGKADPSQVAYQRELVVQGKVNFSNGRGMARTETDATVTLDLKMAKSPEALAATLAHEATHSAHAAGWGMNVSVYVEETSGNLASAAVWGEIGDPNDQNLTTDSRDGLNEYAEQFKASGEDGVQARMAAEYAMEASKLYKSKGHPEEAAKVRDVIDHLKDDPGAVKAMKPEYAQEVAQALLRLNPNEDEVEKLGKIFKNLPEAARKALPELIKALPEDAQKVLLKGLNGT